MFKPQYGFDTPWLNEKSEEDLFFIARVLNKAYKAHNKTYYAKIDHYQIQEWESNFLINRLKSQNKPSNLIGNATAYPEDKKALKSPPSDEEPPPAPSLKIDTDKRQKMRIKLSTVTILYLSTGKIWSNRGFLIK